MIKKVAIRRPLKEAAVVFGKEDVKKLTELVKLAKEIGLTTVNDLLKFLKNEANSGESIYGALKRYRDELGDDFAIKVEECYAKLGECSSKKIRVLKEKKCDLHESGVGSWYQNADGTYDDGIVRKYVPADKVAEIIDNNFIFEEDEDPHDIVVEYLPDGKVCHVFYTDADGIEGDYQPDLDDEQWAEIEATLTEGCCKRNAKNTDTKLTEDWEDWSEMPPLLTFPYAVQLQKVKQMAQDSEEQDDSMTCGVTDVVNTEEWGEVNFFLDVHADECEEGEIGRYVLGVNYIDSQFDKFGDEFTGTDMVECDFRSAEELIDYINDRKFRDTFTADDPNTPVYVPATHNASKQGNIAQPASVTPATTASNALITKTRAQQEAIVDGAAATKKKPQAIPVTDVISHKRYGNIQFYFVYNPRSNNYGLNVFYLDKPSLNFNSVYGTGFKYFNTKDELLDYINGSEFKTRFLECYTKLGECGTKKPLKEDKFYISDDDVEDDFTRLMHFLAVSGYTETDNQEAKDKLKQVRDEAEAEMFNKLEAEAEEADELNIPFNKDIAKEVAIAGDRAVERWKAKDKAKIKALLSTTRDGYIKLTARASEALDTAREIAADFDCPIEKEYEVKNRDGSRYIMVINPYCGYEYGTPECDAAIAKWTPANQKVYDKRKKKVDVDDDLDDLDDDDIDEAVEPAKPEETHAKEPDKNQPTDGAEEDVLEDDEQVRCEECGRLTPKKNLKEEIDLGFICPACIRRHRRLGESITFIIKKVK